MSIALTLHLLAVVIWVGGIFFAFVIFRPVSATQLGTPVRLTLFTGVFNQFLPWVLACIFVLLASGYWMIFGPYGGMAQAPKYIHIMQTLGLIMMAIFAHLYFAPFKRLKQAVVAQNWELASTQMNQMRLLMGINLALGLVTTIVGTAGKYWQ